MSSPPTRSLFGSLKDKLSRSRSRTPSPKPEASAQDFAPAPAPAVTKPRDGDDLSAPPPYSAVAPAITLNSTSLPRDQSPAPSFSSARSDPSITSPEDPYAFLASFDTVFLIDDSASMAGQSWREVRDVLSAIAPICTAHDTNGIDIYFLHARNRGPGTGDAHGYRGVRTAAQVETIFASVRPGRDTPTGTRINHVLRPYLQDYERAVARWGSPDECGIKPINMIVITDGVPTDDPESVIVRAARKLDALDAPLHQIGIQFFQVGNEHGAAAALRELDDGLAEQDGVRDMVDTVTWETRGARPQLSADAILKVVLGAVIKRLDRRRLSGESRRRDRLAP